MRQPIPEPREITPWHVGELRSGAVGHALGRLTHDLEVAQCRVVSKAVRNITSNEHPAVYSITRIAHLTMRSRSTRTSRNAQRLRFDVRP